jgi:hypothetical protein
MERAEHAVAVCVEIRTVWLDQATERLLVASADRAQQLLLPSAVQR